mgnify:CR=1 FL=1
MPQVWRAVPSRFKAIPAVLVVEGRGVRRVVFGRTRKHALLRAAAWSADNGAKVLLFPNPGRV